MKWSHNTSFQLTQFSVLFSFIVIVVQLHSIQTVDGMFEVNMTILYKHQ